MVSVTPTLPHKRDLISNQSLERLKSFQFVRRTDVAEQRWVPRLEPANSSHSHSLNQLGIVSSHTSRGHSAANARDVQSTLTSSGGASSKLTAGINFDHPTQFSSENHGTCNFSLASLSDVTSRTADSEMSQKSLHTFSDDSSPLSIRCTSAQVKRVSKHPLVPITSDAMHLVSSANVSKSHTSLSSSPGHSVSSLIMATTPMSLSTVMSTPTCRTRALLTTPTSQTLAPLSTPNSQTLTPLTTPTTCVLAPLTTPTSHRPIAKAPVSLRYPNSETAPVALSSKRKFPGPAGILPKLVSRFHLKVRRPNDKPDASCNHGH